MKARRNAGNGNRKTGKTGNAKTQVRRRRRRSAAVEEVDFVESLGERLEHTETSPLLTGGDVDADWKSAVSTGEEAVGGSVPTPDQDMVDEIARALGVEQDADEEVHMSAEILRARDRDYWQLERKAAEDELI
jgi:hypothetical protein